MATGLGDRLDDRGAQLITQLVELLLAHPAQVARAGQTGQEGQEVATPRVGRVRGTNPGPWVLGASPAKSRPLPRPCTSDADWARGDDYVSAPPEEPRWLG